LKVLEHVKKYARRSKEDPIILLIDDHKSHCALDSILYARENGSYFPPHCSHRLQPLDVRVQGPFKGKFRMAQHDWMTDNPGKVIKIQDLPSMTNAAYQASDTAKDVTSTFAKPDIYMAILQTCL
jgi:hypothetical protein